MNSGIEYQPGFKNWCLGNTQVGQTRRALSSLWRLNCYSIHSPQRWVRAYILNLNSLIKYGNLKGTESHSNIQNVQGTIQNYSSYQNWENCNFYEKRQSTDANTKMIQILELLDKDFKTTMIKDDLISTYEHSWNKWKNRKLQQRNRYKGQPYGNFKTDNYRNQNLKFTDGLSRWMKITGKN